MKKILPVLLIFLILAATGYWYFFMRTSTTGTTPDTTGTDQQGGFQPFGRPSTGGQQGTETGSIPVVSTSTDVSTPVKIPTLRLLSATPVGGYGASTTASTTVIRWVDRGRGNIYEARGNTLDTITISNTIVPRIYQSIWNKAANAFIASTLDEDGASIGSVYADIKARIIPKAATSTSATSTPRLGLGVGADGQTITPYELKGKNLPENIVAYAASPKRDKLFMLVDDNGTGIGYVSTFDGKSVTQIFSTPLTQLNVEWPEENTIALTTKGTASEGGYLYFVNAKTGIWSKILGPLAGISTRVSTDAKRVLVSTTGSNKNVLASIYTVADKKGIDAIVRTLADKCIWGNFYKEMVYCATPSQPTAGIYPDDWYTGTISTVDKIWQINGATGEIQLVSSIIDTSDRVINAFNLGLDQKDNFLFFMNKDDLSLWSLDLVSSN
ncbi:MAG: hypothetical protein RLY66_73 [Candidatus Parcubacteria bacterium]|jgi:hypothetical protein